MNEESYEAWKIKHDAELQAAKQAMLDVGEPEAWTTDEVCQTFDVLSFGAPVVSVIRKADHVRGLLLFQHSPRIYYHFVPAS